MIWPSLSVLTLMPVIDHDALEPVVVPGTVIVLPLTIVVPSLAVTLTVSPTSAVPEATVAFSFEKLIGLVTVARANAGVVVFFVAVFVAVAVLPDVSVIVAV